MLARLQSAGATLAAIRARNPLVHCLTNAVAASLTANLLACVGASPLMAEAEEEMAAVVPAASAVLVNLGMQTPIRMRAARAVIAAAHRAGVPWVLDPVAAGALHTRTDLARNFAGIAPALIKGNASEILSVSGGAEGGRGTESLHDGTQVLDAARLLARKSGAVVAITGAVDWVTDGVRTAAVRHGHPMMERVSGLGCVAGGLAAACLAVEPDPLAATCHALTLLGIAGQRAAKRARGPGTLAFAMLDCLYELDPDTIEDDGPALERLGA